MFLSYDEGLNSSKNPTTPHLCQTPQTHLAITSSKQPPLLCNGLSMIPNFFFSQITTFETSHERPPLLGDHRRFSFSQNFRSNRLKLQIKSARGLQNRRCLKEMM